MVFLGPPPAAVRGQYWTVDEAAPEAVIVRAATLPPPQPQDWRQHLLDSLRLVGNDRIVGLKRLCPDGRHVFSMGEFLIHPKGFHHLGCMTDGHCYRFPEPVDVIAGGVFAIRRRVFDAVAGPEALALGPLGAVELGLRVRRMGGACYAIPQAVVVDDTRPQTTPAQDAAFRGRWGFDWRAPDLAEVRRLYPGTGLLWNLRYHAPVMPFDRYEYRPAPVWTSYREVEVFRQRVQIIINCARELVPAQGSILEIGCGDGLFTHLLAQTGLRVIGMDLQPAGIADALRQTAGQAYAGPRPVFLIADSHDPPFADAAFDALCLIDVIEHLDNPIRTLNRIVRLIRPGGGLLLVTPSWQFGASSDPMYHGFEYTADELQAQVSAVSGLHIAKTGSIGGVYHDLVLLARRT